MPKNIVVNPVEIRKKGKIKIKDIPLNSYTPDITKEVSVYGEAGLKKMYHDMLVIREFEMMLNSIKQENNYRGIEYNHRGPAHLSAGQESAAVGQSYHLDVDDFIFGSHRSHGEILAKCFSAIDKLSGTELQSIMETFDGGSILKVVEKSSKKSSVKDLAEDFVLYGALAEIFARATGFNKGLGGSMHTFFAPFGSMPNNAIVGGSADISMGSALYKRVNRKPGIVIGNVGDASLGCGPVWEALSFGAMDQYKTLWDKDIGGAPPFMLNIFNNFYGMGGQTSGETMGYGYAARVGAGVNAENMHSERVDGFNPLAVADAVSRKKKLLLGGEGPVFMETITYRLTGHSPSDASSYRTKEELDSFKEQDSLKAYGTYLLENGVISESETGEMKEAIAEKMSKIMKLSIDDELSPRVNGTFIESVMFSGESKRALAGGEPEVLIPKEKNPRLKRLAKKERYAFDKNGKKFSPAKTFAMRDALFEAMLDGFYSDPTMIAYGEENRDWGGAFGVYGGLTEALPYHRLFNSPISEAAIVGSGVGYALSGGRAVVELMYCDFLGRAGDEIFNQMPKWQSMSAGVLKMPLVLRVSVGNKYGAQHSQDWTAITAHIPGLKVMYPTTPYDAKGMLNLALSGTDPVVFFESQKLYGIGEMFEKEGVPRSYYTVPEGEPAVRRTGNNLTIITIGATLYTALEAADVLKETYGVESEVIDLRFINPLKYEKLIESVKKTGRVLLASDASQRGSFLHTVASNLGRLAFDYLDGPPVVVGARNWITPPAEMEDLFFPQKEWLIDAVHEQILPLPGHTVSTIQTNGEFLRRTGAGV
ncbi:MAG: dehydrogenase [Spirochaetes bacterium]|nr:MAG: dehydrogenase [Spirochaetota bacterium]